jgi:hypothetical protein
VSTKVYRYAVTVEYAGTFEADLDELRGEDDLTDIAVDEALDGWARDRTIVDVEVEAIDNAGN